MPKAPPPEIRGADLALHLAGAIAAIVHTLDPAGMDIDTDAPLAVGQLLDFEFRPPGSRFKFSASGVVVNVHRRGERLGVRIHFDSMHLRAA